MESACGIEDKKINLSGQGSFAGIEGHRCRITAGLVLYDIYADPVGPDRELFDGGCAEGIAGGHDNFLVILT